MRDRPYYPTMDQICRTNSWVLGEDKGEMVLGIPQDGGRQQAVLVQEFQDSSGQLALRMTANVAPQGKVDAEQALEINGKLPHGAFAVVDGQAVIVVTRTWVYTSQADLNGLLATVAYYAAFYAKHYGA